MWETERMKRIIVCLLTGCMFLSLCAGCGNSEKAAENGESAGACEEITIFAAASLTETLTQIAEEYKKVEPEVEITFNFDSSGTLKTQIVEGAECDLFISASQKQMNQLDAAGGELSEGDYLLAGTRRNLLENKVVLVSAGVDSFEEMAVRLREGSVLLCMGNSDVPVGQYTQKILTYLGLDEESLATAGLITYGSNVKEVTTQIKEGMADCGVVYATDAFSAGLDVKDIADADMCGRVLYPAAVLKKSEHEEQAKSFLEFLESNVAAGIFESVGFTNLSED